MKSSIHTAASIAFTVTLWTITLTTSLVRFTRPYAIRLFWVIATAAIYTAVFLARFILPKLLLIFFIAGCKILEITLVQIRKNPPAVVKINYFPEIVEESPAPENIPVAIAPIEVIPPTPQLPAVTEPTPAIVTTVPKKTKAKSTAPTTTPKKRGRPKKVAA